MLKYSVLFLHRIIITLPTIARMALSCRIFAIVISLFPLASHSPRSTKYALDGFDCRVTS